MSVKRHFKSIAVERRIVADVQMRHRASRRRFRDGGATFRPLFPMQNSCTPTS
jgi:hypothetical protein